MIMHRYLQVFIFLFLNVHIFPGETRILAGRSLEQRPIFIYKFGTGTQAIVIIAGIHGNERNTSVTAYHIINALHNKKLTVPADKSVFIIPEANPDGLAYNSRTNAGKVDLNRNFDTAIWERTAPYHGTILKCGDHPFSEPESRCIRALFDHLIGLDFIPVYISYHSQANSIIEGNGYEFNRHFASFLRKISKYKQVIDYPTYGDSEKWASEKYSVPSATIEFSTKNEPENIENERILGLLLKTDLYDEFYRMYDIPVKNSFVKSELLNNIILETGLELK